MSEKYFVVSESELLRLGHVIRSVERNSGWAGKYTQEELNTAEAACRAHPISRKVVEGFVEVLRTEAVGGYDWEWSDFEAGKAVDSFLKAVGMKE